MVRSPASARLRAPTAGLSAAPSPQPLPPPERKQRKDRRGLSTQDHPLSTKSPRHSAQLSPRRTLLPAFCTHRWVDTGWLWAVEGPIWGQHRPSDPHRTTPQSPAAPPRRFRRSCSSLPWITGPLRRPESCASTARPSHQLAPSDDLSTRRQSYRPRLSHRQPTGRARTTPGQPNNSPTTGQGRTLLPALRSMISRTTPLSPPPDAVPSEGAGPDQPSGHASSQNQVPATTDVPPTGLLPPPRRSVRPVDYSREWSPGETLPPVPSTPACHLPRQNDRPLRTITHHKYRLYASDVRSLRDRGVRDCFT